jgi:phosphoglucomutase
VRKQSVAEIMRGHWNRFGRNYYSRHDYEAVPAADAKALMDHVLDALPKIPGKSFGKLTVERADEFTYRDPVDGSLSEHQGLRIWFKGGARAVLRLSGTGTEGATIRMYLEQLDTKGGAGPADAALGPLAQAMLELAGFERFTGRNVPDVIT